MDIEFPEYNGWSNYATWAAYTHITDNNLQEVFVKQGVQEWLTLKLKGFFSIIYKDHFRELLMQDLLTLAIQFVEWPLVMLALEGKILYKELSNLDEATIAYLEVGLWQNIIAGREQREDEALKIWVRDSIITWVESADARSHATSPLSLLVKKYFAIVIESVDWEQLTNKLK
jgi:hypothetical protein